MRTTFQQLAEYRKYWIKIGHKHVPNPACCCGYSGPFSRSIKETSTNTYRCPIHVGFYYLCYRYLIAMFVLNKHFYFISNLFLFLGSYLTKAGNALNTKIRTFEYNYHDKAPPYTRD